jgi:hypothetical protein
LWIAEGFDELSLKTDAQGCNLEEASVLLFLGLIFKGADAACSGAIIAKVICCNLTQLEIAIRFNPERFPIVLTDAINRAF